MAGVPAEIDLELVTNKLKALPTVVDVHEVHAWTLVGRKHNLWAHIMVEAGASTTPVIYAAQKVAQTFNCHHTCFQVEDAGTYDISREGDACFSQTKS